MAEEVTNINEVRTASDGSVKISVEKYEELLRRANRPVQPPVINRTEVIKTPEMAAKDLRFMGGSFMGLGGTMFVIGAFMYRAGRI